MAHNYIVDHLTIYLYDIIQGFHLNLIHRNWTPNPVMNFEVIGRRSVIIGRWRTGTRKAEARFTKGHEECWGVM